MQAFKVRRQSALHGTRQHGSRGLGDVIQTHTKCYLMWHVPLTSDRQRRASDLNVLGSPNNCEVSGPGCAFKEPDKKS
jgi:hypothetical protein